jgi:hypothetical protein
MHAKLPLRISSFILLLFAIGHTAGFLTFRPASPAALEVLEAMRRVPFDFGGKTVHWIDLYTGFGLAISVSGIFSTIVAWRLSTATIAETPLARTVAWLLCATQIANVVLCMRYFGLVQSGFSLVCSATLSWGALRLSGGGKTAG